MIISFALTTEQFLAGIKTETRRDWVDSTLRAWQRAWDDGRLIHVATDKALYRGGKRIGTFRLTKRPYRQKLSEMTAENLKAEGGMCATIADFCKLVDRDPDDEMTVVHFEKL